MNVRHLAIAGLAVLTTAAAAQVPAPGASATPAEARPAVDLSENDLFFISRWFRGTESKNYSALCGFAIHGNYLSHDVPRPEWEINIQELMAGTTPVVAISAGAFQVVSRDSKAPRQPRPAINTLTFTLEGVADPVSTRIVGQPGSDHAIRGVVDTEPAQKLLTGIYEGVPLTIALGYQDGTSEALKVRNIKDRSHVSGQAGYLLNCTRLLHPLPPGAPSQYRISSPLELASQDPFATHE